MGQQMKTPVPKADNLRTYMVKEENQFPLTCPLASTCTLCTCLHMGAGVMKVERGARENQGAFKTLE